MKINEIISFLEGKGISVSQTTLRNYAKWDLIHKPTTGFGGGRGRYTDYNTDVPYEVYAANKMLAMKVPANLVRIARQYVLSGNIPSWYPDAQDSHIVSFIPEEIERTSPVRWLQYFFEAKYDNGIELPEESCGKPVDGEEESLPEGIVRITAQTSSDKVTVIGRKLVNKKWILLDQVDLKIIR